ncbi:TolC family protein [Asticcacaulis sp. BYS171W]|uniref:TolC family protein n=1 Tax=Asticcacaulis aquaticus TaxID=2984212 RepID=A0ABT5HW04_9CAUL|nr:TolC family protein [Asticcacaulis aquaticus]MDC7684250.1 TolC family protein [Asticcacaulis aquaticus]
MQNKYMRSALGRVGLSLLACASLGLTTMAWAQTQRQPLPLSVALTRAVQNDPALNAVSPRLEAVDGAVQQAGVRPNPTLSLETENVLGSKGYGGIDGAETTLSYSQVYEPSDKRRARQDMALTQRDLIVAEARVRGLDLMHEIETVWIEALTAEAEAELAAERLHMAQRSQKEISRRVNAARDPLFAGALVDASVAKAQISLDQAQLKARTAKAQLAAYWGGSADVEFDLNAFRAPGLPTFVAEDMPDAAVLRARERSSTARIRVETTRPLRDKTLTAGVRHFNADGSVAFVVGGSIPLARHDTNQGAIAQARAEAEAAALDIRAYDLKRARELAAIHARLGGYIHEVKRLDAEVVPQAERAIRLVEEGFARGGFAYRDLMNAHEALLAVKAERIALLKTFHLERARYERLSGQWIALLPEIQQ